MVSSSGPMPAVGVRGLRMLCDAMRATDVDVAEVLAEAGITEAILQDADARIPEEHGRALWAAALATTGDPNLGLHMGRHVRVENLDVIGYLIRAAHDGREAVDVTRRFMRILADGGEITFRESDGRFAILPRWRRPREYARQIEEFVIALMLSVAREVAGSAFVGPCEIHFRHPAPTDVTEHEQILGTRVRFDMPESALVFAVESGARGLPIPSADPGLAAVLERHARQILDKLPPAADFVARVRHCVAEELRGGDPSAEHVARRLGMSARTLRRRLEEMGSGHKVILDDLRRELAHRYLAEDRLEIGEIAYLLGFSEPSAFHRAFKRWTGRTPSEVRGNA